MFGDSKRVAALEAALERQRGVSARWEADWNKARAELSRVSMLVMWLEIAKVHTDENGKRFVYLPDNIRTDAP